MARTPIHTLDLNFQGRPLAISAYMLEHSSGIVLVESGPGSTIESLKLLLHNHGYRLEDITHVFITHIHLDHAGASGSLAAHGAQIHVHPMGAAHMLNPEKLLNSAARIYGDRMDTLWGQFNPVPEEKLTILEDNQEVVVGNLRFRALNTPGHAEHHYCYQFEDLCFTGDVGAVRIPGYPYLRVPMPPPEFHYEKWRETISFLKKKDFKRIALTHFGIFEDVDWHFKSILAALDDVDAWMNTNMPENLPVEILRARFLELMDEQAIRQGLDPKVAMAYQLSNPVGMSVDGLIRYWKKFRLGSV
ncbi:MAG: MBL fold metallo-hydrolase [Chloroflexi bacterium]|nr:MBL fold metallo-hydrolase [Chloroflexota bacterium]